MMQLKSERDILRNELEKGPGAINRSIFQSDFLTVEASGNGNLSQLSRLNLLI